jgi:hypothetical protein
MKLNVDFSELFRAVAPLEYVVTEFVLDGGAGDLEGISRGLNRGMVLGEGINLNQIDGSNGVLNYDGHQVMLYMPDQGDNAEAVLKNGKLGTRVHVAECSIIELMREKGRLKRYDIISRIDGSFPVFGHDSDGEIEGGTDLEACKSCLKILNYKGCNTQPEMINRQVFDNFSFAQFFEAYSSYFKGLPAKIAKSSTSYTDNWYSISSKLRNELDYKCEQCNVDLSSDKTLLHTLHINGNKANNKRSNLKVLCADCLKKHPRRESVYVSNAETLKINQLRREQHQFDDCDYSLLLKRADTALYGLIHKCQYRKMPIPQLGVVVMEGEYPIMIDICWPEQKIAVLIDVSRAKMLLKQGWSVYSSFDTLTYFDVFQERLMDAINQQK